MRLATSAAALAIATLALAACDRPATQSTAYNNSGSSAVPGSTTAGTTAPTTTTTTTSTTTSDTAAPATTSMAPGPAGDATGVVSETITTGKIKAALAADAGLKDSDISVTTNNGVVMLSGTAKSQDQVSAAMALAQRQDGVSKVENSIAVR